MPAIASIRPMCTALLLSALGLLATGCRKERIYEVNEVQLRAPSANKDKLKTSEEYVAILHANLFQTALSANEVYQLAQCIDRLGAGVQPAGQRRGGAGVAQRYPELAGTGREAAERAVEGFPLLGQRGAELVVTDRDQVRLDRGGVVLDRRGHALECEFDRVTVGSGLDPEFL